MGSWNGTCGFSQLPIFRDDSCRLIFLIKSMRQPRALTSGGFSYANELFNPVGIALKGTYNEGGMLVDLEDPDNHLFNTFNAICKQETEGSEITNLEDLQNSIARKETKSLSYVLVLEEVFQSAIKTFLKLEEENNFRFEKQEYENSLESYISLYQTGNETDFKNHSKSEYFSMNTSYQFYLNHNKLSGIKNELTELHLFTCALSQARKFYCPQSGAGNQDAIFDYAELIGNIAKDKKQQYLNDIDW